MNSSVGTTAEARARQSLGQSDDAIYRAVMSALRARAARGSVVDVGCGTGRLRPWIVEMAESYLGVDVVRYPAYPADASFVSADLNREPIPVPDAAADICVSVETIEHLENPRAFVRELVRILRPGGWLVVTTPNQRSFTSLGALLFKNHFSAFEDNSYPAHVTALLDTDLQRIALENALVEVAIAFTGSGRVPLTARRYPRWFSRALPRGGSDHVLLIARKPER